MKLELTLILTVVKLTTSSFYILSTEGDYHRTIISFDSGKVWSRNGLENIRSPDNGFCLNDKICYLVSLVKEKQYKIHKTEDGGKTWTQGKEFKLPGPEKDYYSGNSGFYCFKEDYCMLGGYDAFVLTTNLFESYSRMLLFPTLKNNDDADVTGIQCVKNNTVCIMTVEYKYSGAIYRSVDGGYSWKKQKDVGGAQALSCTETRRGSFCAVAQDAGSQDFGSVLFSDNDGAIWKSLTYKFERKYFSPSCPFSGFPYRCSMTKRVDKIQCVEPYNCMVTFRGYKTGSGTRERIQNGALCNLIKYKGEEATMKCEQMFRNIQGVKVHCTSKTNCMAVGTYRSLKYEGFQKYYEYTANMYAYNSQSRRWSSLTKPTVTNYGTVQRIFGTVDNERPDFDFRSGGGGLQKGGKDGGDGGKKDGSSENRIYLNIYLVIGLIPLVLWFI